MRLIGIDYGEKRAGIASTDESGEFALPRTVLPNDDKLISAVLKLKEKEGAEAVVIGESKNLDGTANPILEKILSFKSELEGLGVKVHLHPEVFTTMEARQLQGNTEMTDASAASLILKSYIDNQKP